MNKAKISMILGLKILLILSPFVLFGGLLLLYRFGSPFPCFIYQTTGFYCPGCGAGRGLYALLHLKIGAALRYNAPFILLMPLVAYFYLKLSVWFITGKDLLPFRFKHPLLWIILPIALLLFGVLRNIPFFPFTLLAP